MAHRTGKQNRCLLFILVLLLAVLLSPHPAGSASAAEAPDAMLETGTIVNARMKSLAAGAEVETWKITEDIKAIRMADSLPEGFVPSEANTVSAADSRLPVYIFFDNEDGAGILYFYTEGKTIALNPDSAALFARNSALTDISGVAGWDTSRAVTLRGMFLRDTALADISALAEWDTSAVTDMYALFSYNASLKDALALRYWDTSSVTDMTAMFCNAQSLRYADVSHWNTGKVTSMANMFQVGESYLGNGQLEEILGLGELDVSNVRDMTCMFYGAGQMTHYDIAGWDVSKVESMNHMFCDNYKLRSLDLSRWDVSSLKTIFCMFDDNQKLKTIGDVSHWNTSSLLDAGGWLNDARSFIGDKNGMLDLSGWDTSHLKSTTEMFLNTKLRTIDLSGWTFDSVTNEWWEGAGRGIFYEAGRGMSTMFMGTTELNTVYLSREGMESFNAAVENEINMEDMWTGSKIAGFTVR